LIDLEKGEALMQVIVVGEQGLELSGEGRGGKPMRRSVSQRELNDYRAPRGRKGKPIEPRWKAPVMAVAGRGPSLGRARVVDSPLGPAGLAVQQTTRRSIGAGMGRGLRGSEAYAA
jgi:hypothetical protein